MRLVFDRRRIMLVRSASEFGFARRPNCEAEDDAIPLPMLLLRPYLVVQAMGCRIIPDLVRDKRPA